MDVERCRILNEWLEGISLPPEITAVWAEADEHDAGYHLLLSAADQPDVEVEGELVAGGVSAYIPDTPRSRNGLAVDIMTALTVRAFHEAVEWVKVDGLRLANPHPEATDYMWEWLASRLREVVEEYINAFPGQTDWWARVTDPRNGQVLYDGPSPVPDGLLEDGQMYTFDMSPVFFDGPTHSVVE
jgi:hypothetical protein